MAARRFRGRRNADDVEAEQLVHVAEETGATELDLTRVAVLKRLPPAISRLTSLRSLKAVWIDSLEALEGLVELRELDVGWRFPTDHARLDLSPLAHLTKLRTLKLSGPVKSLVPLLSLPKLESLKLLRSRCDLSPIAQLLGLETLELCETPGRIPPLSQLKNLRSITIKRRQRLSDIGFVAGLEDLKLVDFNTTSLSDISALSQFASLERLDLGHCNVSDIRALARLKSLRWLNLDHNRVLDLDPLRGLTGLEWLQLRGTKIVDIEPIARHSKLKALWLDETPVSKLPMLDELRSLRTLSLYKTKVRDISRLAPLTGLIEGVIADKNMGLNYSQTPASQAPPFRVLARLQEPALTIETINYVRRVQNLNTVWPRKYVRPPEVERILAGEAFEPAQVIDHAPAKPLPPPTSATRFAVTDGQVAVVPPMSWGGPDAQATIYHWKARQLAIALAERLVRTDAAPDAAASVAALAGILGESVEKVQPDQLRLAWRAISARARAYAHPSAKGELGAESVAALFELSDVLIDLQTFVRTELEANEQAIRRLNLTPEAAASAKIALDEIADAFEASPAAVTEDARELLGAAALASASIQDQESKVCRGIGAAVDGRKPCACDRPRTFSRRTIRTRIKSFIDKRRIPDFRYEAPDGGGSAAEGANLGRC